jgi:methylglyoxal synthase
VEGRGGDSELEKKLITDLRAVARKRWDDTEAFEFEWMPGLTETLELTDGEDEVERLRRRLQEEVVEMGEQENKSKPRFNRSLAEAWTVLLGLTDRWADRELSDRRAHLTGTWRTKRNQKIVSVDGFTKNQEPVIYKALAKRLLLSYQSKEGQAALRLSTAKKMPPVKPAPWPDLGHVPSEGQEIVILIAAHALRRGPGSQLAKLVREFGPYWRATEAMVYAPEGSYKAIWRAGLLHDYKNFRPLPAGFAGGLVHATEIVIAAAEANPRSTAHVVFLIDPHEDSSLYPATSSLKRECLLTNTAFLTNHEGAARWFRLEWARRVAEGREPNAKDLLLERPADGFSESSGLSHGTRILALAAHDRHKRALMDFADNFAGLFERHYGRPWATRVSGHLLNGGSIFDEEYAEDILYDVKGQRREDLKALIEQKTFAWEMEERESGPGSVDWAQQLTRGRQGGVIQLARKVLNEECDTILFFQDAETPREHDMEIQVLDRSAEMAGNQCLILYDEQSAARWAENVCVCLDGEGAPGATTLVDAYRRVFGVELVLAEPGPDEEGGDKATWKRITRTAATQVVGALSAARSRRAEKGEPVRLGLPWGGAILDVLGAVDEDRTQTSRDDGPEDEFERVLAGALGLQEFVEEKRDVKDLYDDRQYALRAGQWLPAPKAPHPFAADGLRVIPTVGVIGARDRSRESYSLVERAVKILGGGGITYPASAFALRQDARDDPLGEPLDEEWKRIDVLMLSAAPMQRRPNPDSPALATALPADLAESYADCVGAISTIYLEQNADGVTQRNHHSYRQVGIKLEQIRKLRKDDASVILVNGAEKDEGRRKACWAALKAGAATTFVTDREFAWAVLMEEVPELSRTTGT